MLAKAGHQVIGIDLSEKRVDDILNLNIEPEPKVLGMLEGTLQNNLRVTNAFNDGFQESEMSFLIVPTPSNAAGEFVNTYLESAIKSIGTILETYDDNKSFPVWGFGGIPKFMGDTDPNHCFPLNGDPMNPEVNGA